jgi:hypothetical protein
MDGDGGYGGGKGMGFLKPKSQRKPAAKKRESPSRNEYLQTASPSKVMSSLPLQCPRENKLGQKSISLGHTPSDVSFVEGGNDHDPGARG